MKLRKEYLWHPFVVIYILVGACCFTINVYPFFEVFIAVSIVALIGLSLFGIGWSLASYWDWWKKKYEN